MLSNLLGLIGLAVLTYGIYVMAGEGPALIVGGVFLVVLGEATDKVQLNLLGTARKLVKRPAKG